MRECMWIAVQVKIALSGVQQLRYSIESQYKQEFPYWALSYPQHHDTKHPQSLWSIHGSKPAQAHCSRQRSLACCSVWILYVTGLGFFLHFIDWLRDGQLPNSWYNHSYRARAPLWPPLPWVQHPLQQPWLVTPHILLQASLTRGPWPSPLSLPL